MSCRAESCHRLRAGHVVLVACVCGLLGGCGGGDGGTEPLEGAIHITVATSGTSLDIDGYDVSADGGAAQPLPINGSAILSALAPGGHDVALAGVAANCTVSGANPRTVTVSAGSVAEITFTVSCTTSPGSIAVTTSTTGVDPDPDGYSVALDGVPAGSILSTGSLTLSPVAAGAHIVLLDGVAENCSVAGANGRSLTVPATGTPPVAVRFDVTCHTPIPTLAFWSDRDGETDQIFVVRSDGTGLQPLAVVFFPEQNFDPDWSPDGSKIAFSSNRSGAGAGNDIWVVGANNDNLHPLTSDPETSKDPDWSPDGSRIAFTKDLQITVMNADGSNVTPVGNDPGGAHSPAWSPDGSKIAFVSLRDGNAEIYVMNSDGTDPVRLTNTSAEERRPTWSADGSRLAFASDRDGDFEIFVMGADGSNPVNLTNNEDVDVSPAWSPDGSRLAFASDRASGLHIWIMETDGANATQVTTGDEFQTDDGPDWKP